MSSQTRTYDMVRDTFLSARKIVSPAEMVNFYNTWAENYDKDVATIDYRAPVLAAKTVSSHFTGDRGAALVLDVACGTGLVATEMKKHGFSHFFGLDGSKGMLELAKNTGLYEDVQLCMLGNDELPVQPGPFDVVLIVGALGVGHIPACIAKELCKVTKPGGLVCMTTRNTRESAQLKAALEQHLNLMEEQGLWSCVNITDVEGWERELSANDEGYDSGTVFLYRVSDVPQ